MASFLEGSNFGAGYNPVQTAPNLSFMANALDKVNAQYEQNFSKIASVYNSVVNAPLTNIANKALRDQYALKAKDQLKQLSSTDLSVEANVQQADKIFAPFYQDQRLIADMAWTKRDMIEEQKDENLRNSSDPEIKDTYSSIPGQLRQYYRERIKNGDPSDASIYDKTPIVRSTPFYDLSRDVSQWIKDNNYSIKSVQRGNGNVVTITNGETTYNSYAELAQAIKGSKYSEQERLMGEYMKVMGVSGIKKDYALRGLDITDSEAEKQLPQYYAKELADTYKSSNSDIEQRIAQLKSNAERAMMSGNTQEAFGYGKAAEALKKQHDDNNISIQSLSDPKSQKYAELSKNILRDPSSFFGGVYASKQVEQAARLAANNTKVEVDKDSSYWEGEHMRWEQTKWMDEVNLRREAIQSRLYGRGASTDGSLSGGSMGSSDFGGSGGGMGSSEKPNGDSDRDGVKNILDNINPTILPNNSSIKTETAFQVYEHTMNNMVHDARQAQADAFRSGVSGFVGNYLGSQQADALAAMVKSGRADEQGRTMMRQIAKKLKADGVIQKESDISGPTSIYGALSIAQEKELNRLNEENNKLLEQGIYNEELTQKIQQESQAYTQLHEATQMLNNVSNYQNQYKKAVTDRLKNDKFSDIRFQERDGSYKLITPDLISRYGLPADLAQKYLDGTLEIKSGWKKTGNIGSPVVDHNYSYVDPNGKPIPRGWQTERLEKFLSEHPEQAANYRKVDHPITNFPNSTLSNEQHHYVNDGKGHVYDITPLVNILGNSKDYSKKYKAGIKAFEQNMLTLDPKSMEYFKNRTGQMGMSIGYTAGSAYDKADQIAENVFTGGMMDYDDDKIKVVSANDSDAEAQRALIEAVRGDVKNGLSRVELLPISPGNPNARAVKFSYNLGKIKDGMSKDQKKELEGSTGQFIVELRPDAQVNAFPSPKEYGYYNMLLETNSDKFSPAIRSSPAEEKMGIKYSLYRNADGKVVFNLGRQVANYDPNQKKVVTRWVSSQGVDKPYNPNEYNLLPDNVTVEDFISKLKSTSLDNWLLNQRVYKTNNKRTVPAVSDADKSALESMFSLSK